MMDGVAAARTPRCIAVVPLQCMSAHRRMTRVVGLHDGGSWNDYVVHDTKPESIRRA